MCFVQVIHLQDLPCPLRVSRIKRFHCHLVASCVHRHLLLAVPLVSIISLAHIAAHILDYVPHVVQKVAVLLPGLLGAAVPVVPPICRVRHAAVVLAACKLVLRQQVIQLGALARQLLLPLAQRVCPCLGVYVRGLAGFPGRRLLCCALGPVCAVPGRKAVCHLFCRAGPGARIAKKAAQGAPVGAVLAVVAKARAVRRIHAVQCVLNACVVSVVVGSRHGRFCLCLLFLLVVQPFKSPHFVLLPSSDGSSDKEERNDLRRKT